SDPHLIAVEHEERSITYGELNQRADEIACLLMNRGVKVGDYVGLVTTRSIEMVCGIFGILKAGGAYIPIDHELPLERIHYMLELAQCSTIMYHPDIRPEVLAGLTMSELICLSETSSSIVYALPQADECDPCLVVFTSGSTGNPKGVMIRHSSPHRSLVNYSLSVSTSFHIDIGDRVAQLASIGNNPTLASESTLVLRETNDYFANLKTVNVAFLTPTVGGDFYSPSLREKWGSYAVLINEYGPTESCIGSSFSRIETEDHIIGKPLSNTVQYIVDSSLQLVPIGVPGELLIGGVGVALGYLNRPDLTKEKFIDNHFLNDGSKMYRTGDICKWTEDGNIQILGRRDDMVKVKGYRIELDEVSSAISRHPDVTGSAVIVKDDQLIAFMTPETVNVDSIRDFVTDILPTFMFPHIYVTLKEFPMNTNGKVIIGLRCINLLD
ncbi:hypothetical protein HDV02_005082, partial [Globomyces sp. JEL0801]